MAGFGGIWRDSAGFGGNQLLTVFLLACKHSVQRRFLRGQQLSPKSLLFPPLVLDGIQAQPPFVNPLMTSGQKLRSGPPNPGKQAFWHGHAARTSTKKLRSEKLRADFSYPKIGRELLPSVFACLDDRFSESMT